MRIGVIILVVSCVSAAQTAKHITGDYSNLALGYEVTVPEGLVGIIGDQPGPERLRKSRAPHGGARGSPDVGC